MEIIKIVQDGIELDVIGSVDASSITQDADNRFVTDTEKTTWNNKQNKLTAGSNISIDSNNKISAAVTITKSDLGLGSVENIGIKILTQSQYDALSSTEKNRTDKLYGIYEE